MSAPASAEQIKPGTKITPANVDLVKDFVSPGVYWRAKNGMVMNIIPTGRIDWPPPYKEATEKYSSQVRLAKIAFRCKVTSPASHFPHRCERPGHRRQTHLERHVPSDVD